MLVSLGGGAKDLNVKVLSSIKGPMVIAELIVNTGDAMGANAVNTMAEAVAPIVERVTGGKVYLRIISNLADRRLIRVSATFDKEAIGGEAAVDGVVYAYAFAEADPYRCSTHNKGIMNGVIAVAIACGQDIRALEAGAHTYAAKHGGYKPLSTWEKNQDGDLVGTLEMPMAVGLVGGAAKTHPAAKAAIKIARRQDGDRAGRGHGSGRAGAELRGAQGARVRGNPEGAHEAARPQRGRERWRDRRPRRHRGEQDDSGEDDPFRQGEGDRRRTREEVKGQPPPPTPGIDRVVPLSRRRGGAPGEPRTKGRARDRFSVWSPLLVLREGRDHRVGVLKVW